MAYTTINKPSATAFNTKPYTGNNSYGHSITGVGFQPDFVWIKSRNTAKDSNIYDAVRGTDKTLESNTNDAERTAVNLLGSFDSDGFTVDDDSQINGNYTYASWNWKAGTTSIPTGGSLDATAVSINTTAGFGIYSYTGNGTVRSIAHGLGSIPKMMIIKRLNSTRDWSVYHASLPLAEHLELNNSDAAATANLWWSSRPTSSLIYFNGDGQVNGGSDPYIMYAFAEKQGYSKFGSYTGNGNADGTFVYTGFKPAFVMTKKTSGTSSWDMHDTKRDTFNVASKHLLAEDAGAEGNTAILDILSNGFKFRSSNGDRNASGGTYIYMAFAEAPLVGTNNVPCTAR